jgi:hypothetical protein
MASLNSSDRARSLRSASGAILISNDRRQRSRLRDLCDEVLASFRVASGREPISEQDRVLAGQILPRVARLSQG